MIIHIIFQDYENDWFALRAQHKISPGTWAVAREIVKTQGLGFKGINKGVTATIGRNGLFNMVYFGLFHTVNTRIEQPKVRGIYIFFTVISLIQI